MSRLGTNKLERCGEVMIAANPWQAGGVSHVILPTFYLRVPLERKRDATRRDFYRARQFTFHLDVAIRVHTFRNIMAPSESELVLQLKSSVKTFFVSDRDQLTVKKVRSAVEEELDLETGFFLSPEWKDKSKQIIKEHVVSHSQCPTQLALNCISAGTSGRPRRSWSFNRCRTYTRKEEESRSSAKENSCS